VTLGYVDGEGKQQVLVFRVDKGDIRTVLAGLQARTGRRVEYQATTRGSGSGRINMPVVWGWIWMVAAAGRRRLQ